MKCSLHALQTRRYLLLEAFVKVDNVLLLELAEHFNFAHRSLLHNFVIV